MSGRRKDSREPPHGRCDASSFRLPRATRYRAGYSRAMPRRRLGREEALRLTVERAASCGFFFDFDGVLAPIAEDPEQVYPAAGLIEAIGELSRYVERLVIVSARP